MKKSLLLLLMLCLVLPAAGCASAPTQNAGEKQITIGISMPTLREASWQFAKDTMEAYCKEKGYAYQSVAADANQAQQTSQVEDLLTKGIDVLIIGPEDGTAAATIAVKCKEEGVPIVCYDRIISHKDVDYYVAINPRRVGEFQGQYIAEHAKPGAIMLFGGGPDDSNSIHYFDGAMSFIQPKINDGTLTVIGGDKYEQVVTEQWLPEKAQARAENILAANPDAIVTAVLSPNDGLAGGVIQALKANGITDYVITGQDAEEAAIAMLKTGEQSMTVFVSAKSTLQKVVDVAAQAAKGEKVETNGVLNNGVIDVPAVLEDPFIMTKENWKSILEANDLYDPAIYGE